MHLLAQERPLVSVATIFVLFDTSALDLDVGLADDPVNRGFTCSTVPVRIVVVVETPPLSLLAHCS